MPFLLAEILNFQGSTHRIGVGSFSQITDGSMMNTEKTRRMFIMQCPLEMVFMIFCSMGNR